jgi:hypothetical protein
MRGGDVRGFQIGSPQIACVADAERQPKRGNIVPKDLKIRDHPRHNTLLRNIYMMENHCQNTWPPGLRANRV